MRSSQISGTKCKIAINIILLVCLWNATSVSEAAKHRKDDKLCRSKTGYPPYKRNGKRPSASDMSYCSRWRESTCCDEAQTNLARVSVFSMAKGAQGKCHEMWRNLQCAVCHPDMGTINSGLAGDNKVPICSHFCNDLFGNCTNTLFAGDEDHHIRGCTENDIICTQLKHWELTARQFCELAGFKVVYASSLNSRGQKVCFNGTEEDVEMEKQKRPRSRSGKPKDRSKKKGKSKSSAGQDWMLSYYRYALVAALIVMGMVYILSILESQHRHRKFIERLQKKRQSASRRRP